ncbi:hypothetical protein ONZ45_g8015 [Pleurotus djamor]|nr:hypothetical protein ONZ45_g8015 [Pleurotus djamor]
MGTDDGEKKKSLKDVIRHFTPAWFAVNMGTGAISILFFAFPYANGSTAMKTMSLIFFFLNLALLVVFTLITTARYILFPDLWALMIRHPVQSLFLGCAPMGAATLINVAVNLINVDMQFGGKPFLYFLWGAWWMDVAVSALCCWGLVHVMMTRHDQPLERMTAVWLLPVVTLIVASSTGGVLATPLSHYSPSHALITVTSSVFLVSIGLSLAFMMLTVYLLRLVSYGLPPGASIISSFLPLGPMGQAGYSILLIGQVFQKLLPYGNVGFLASTTAGDIIHVACTCIAFFLWSLTTMWVAYALLGVQETVRKVRFPFKVPFWGLIFPNGVYANLTLALANTFDSSFFRLYGAIYSVATLVLWTVVAARTLSLTRDGEIFESPCINELNMSRCNGTAPANPANSKPCQNGTAAH